jgi:copper(I)-binding protein
MKSIVTKLTAILSLPLIFCAPAISFADGHGKGISIDDPYVRAVPPGQMNTGVFMKIINHADTKRIIVSAESDAAKVVELHTHIKEEGMMKMRQIEKIDIPAKGHAMLMPGGLHVMLIGLNQPIEVDKPVEVTLVFNNGERKTVEAVGRKLKMKMMHHEGMNHGNMKHQAMKHKMN